MAFDIKKFLMEDLGFGEEAATKYAADIKPEQATKLEQHQTRLSGLTAREKEIAKLQTDLQAANDNLTKEMVEWAKLSEREKAQATEQQGVLEAARTRAVQLETRLTALATQHGIDPKTLLDGTATIPAKKEEVVPAIDPNRFVSTENFGAMSAFMLELPFKLHQIAAEHLELTGQRLDTSVIAEEIKARAGKKGANVDPVAIWEEKFDVAAKRTAKAEATRAQEIKEAEARGEERGRSEQALPGQTPPGRHSPVFGVRGGDGAVAPRTSVLKRPQPETGVRSAAAALQSGKYRQKTA